MSGISVSPLKGADAKLEDKKEDSGLAQKSNNLHDLSPLTINNKFGFASSNQGSLVAPNSHSEAQKTDQ